MARKWSFGILCVLMVSVFVICGTVGSSYAGEKVIRWRGQNAYPMPSLKGTPFKGSEAVSGNIAVEICKWMEQMSNGRLKIDLAQAGAIVPVKDMFNAVSKGALDIVGLMYAGFYTGTIPEVDVEIGLPMAWQTADWWWDGIYNRGLYEEFQTIYDEHNIHWIPCVSNEGYSIQTTFPISRLSDLKGKKLRALGIYGELVKKLGASPVVMSGKEMYMGLKLGTIDGCIYGTTSLDALNLREVNKYIVRVPNLNTIGVNILVNKDSWNKLPADLKKTINDNVRYKSLELAMNNHMYEDWVVAQSEKDYGLKTVALPPEDVKELEKICFGLWDGVAKKSPRCAKLVNIVKDQMKTFGRGKEVK